VTEDDFRSIFREHKDVVYRFAWRMTGSASGAEDVTQDCFLALLRAPERFDAGRGPIRAFLVGMARNLILKRWRAESRWDPLEDDTFAAEPWSPIEGKRRSWWLRPWDCSRRSSARLWFLWCTKK
jgi:RNA polymerase sigma-70 factor (ECF subfamily)